MNTYNKIPLSVRFFPRWENSNLKVTSLHFENKTKVKSLHPPGGGQWTNASPRARCCSERTGA